MTDNQILTSITFSDSAESEAKQLLAETKLIDILHRLQKGGEMSFADKQDIVNLLLVVLDIFDTDLPEIYSDPMFTLQLISRDINLSRVLRERGVFRLFRIIREYTTDDGLPFYVDIINPETGQNFRTQNEFLGWFTQNAHISRSLVFLRIGIIRRLLNLGVTLKRAYQIMLSKPSVIRDVLELVAEWDDNHEFVSIDPSTLLRITEHVSPDQMDEVIQLTDAMEEDPDNPQLVQALNDVAKPVLIGLLDEVARHPSASDAIDLVQHDILTKPEVNYRWDQDAQALLVDLIRKSLDPRGVEYIAEIITIPFHPETIEPLPQEIVNDILRRLPIKNRAYLDK